MQSVTDKELCYFRAIWINVRKLHIALKNMQFLLVQIESFRSKADLIPQEKIHM